MTDPQGSAPVNTPAYRAGIERANAPIHTDTTDQRIQHKDIVTFAPPAHLTDDYDPTYRPSSIDRTAGHQSDADAVALAEQLIANGTWKRCSECGHGITTGLRVHATCEQARKAGAA